MAARENERREGKPETRHHEDRSEFGFERQVGRRDRGMKWMSPMLATLTREQFSDPEWIFEPKLDGIRCLAYRQRQKLDLYSRNKLRLNETFSELVEPLLKQRAQSFVLDGEVVAM